MERVRTCSIRSFRRKPVVTALVLSVCLANGRVALMAEQSQTHLNTESATASLRAWQRLDSAVVRSKAEVPNVVGHASLSLESDFGDDAVDPPVAPIHRAMKREAHKLALAQQNHVTKADADLLQTDCWVGLTIGTALTVFSWVVLKEVPEDPFNSFHPAWGEHKVRTGIGFGLLGAGLAFAGWGAIKCVDSISARSKAQAASPDSPPSYGARGGGSLPPFQLAQNSNGTTTVTIINNTAYSLQVDLSGNTGMIGPFSSRTFSNIGPGQYSETAEALGASGIAPFSGMIAIQAGYDNRQTFSLGPK